LIRAHSLIDAWENKLLALGSVKNSTPECFADIYNLFIQRRGAEGWVGERCKSE